MLRNQRSMFIPFNVIGKIGEETIFAKKAIEKYSEKITAAILFTEPLKMWEIYNSKSRRSLEEKNRNIVSKLAQGIAEKIDDIFMKPRTGVLDIR